MLCVKILPESVEKCFSVEKALLKNIVEGLKEEVEGYNILVLVNDKLVENYDLEITSADRIIVVKENIGG
ncbi:hypothetical protein IMZ38_00255 [Thermosphaera chiliense]|uniref:MoaD/ThiS family protein n=1 Tax=Thermosphaera chiliense TaxID=3402707 RepID=A0A7M1UQU6_9CREN|nr:hypothetical protein [Thermosphaera aggregans]QOR94436.1 hypothetical protein IMZ38_00255 [Thermosphaera aggregans]